MTISFHAKVGIGVSSVSAGAAAGCVVLAATSVAFGPVALITALALIAFTGLSSMATAVNIISNQEKPPLDQEKPLSHFKTMAFLLQAFAKGVTESCSPELSYTCIFAVPTVGVILGSVYLGAVGGVACTVGSVILGVASVALAAITLFCLIIACICAKVKSGSH